MRKTSRLFIGGVWTDSVSRDSICITDPSTGNVIAAVARGGAEDVNFAVQAARNAFEGEWAGVGHAERGRLLFEFGRVIRKHQDELTRIEASDTGVPVRQARSGVLSAARSFEYFGGMADKLRGSTMPSSDGCQVNVWNEPRGVAGHIISWNYPAQMYGSMVAPSLAAGNTVVLKPSEQACLSCIRLTQLADEIGFPPGVLNLVTGYGEEAGAALAGRADIDFLQFIGSRETGICISQSTARNLVPCSVQLSEKYPQVVFDDANIEDAVSGVAEAALRNWGQEALASSRVFIQRSLYETFISALAQRFASIRVGPPLADMDCGPVISRGRLVAIESGLRRARHDRIPMLARGKLDCSAQTGGFYSLPALLGPVPTDHRLANQEMFGPVLFAIPFDTEYDAVHIVNKTAGRGAGLWTVGGSRQMRMARRLRVDRICINGYGGGSGPDALKGSADRGACSCGGGLESMRGFIRAKTVALRVN